MTEPINLARRGALKALSMATALVAGPGKAIAGAALAAAEAMPAAGMASDLMKSGAPKMSGGSSRRLGAYDSGTPANFALQVLNDEIWGGDRYRIRSPDDIRGSIRCLRSASPAVQELWEIRARKDRQEHERICSIAADFIREGKFL